MRAVKAECGGPDIQIISPERPIVLLLSLDDSDAVIESVTEEGVTVCSALGL